MSANEFLDSIANSLADAVVELKKQTMLLEQLHRDNEEKIEVFLGKKQQKTRGPLTTEKVKAAFAPELRKLLRFESTGEYEIIKPVQYLGSDVFGRIAAIVRDDLGGEYVSAGRDSHFRVPRK